MGPDACPAGVRHRRSGVIAQLDAFLAAHASTIALAPVLYARGEALWDQLRASPPDDARWGRFLAAMGEVAAERLGDDRAAAAWFRRCLDAEPAHRDAEACVAAGHGQAVLWERAGEALRALPAYRAAASEGLRCAAIAPVTVRAACSAVRLGFDRTGRLDEGDARLAKQAWLAWTWLAERRPDALASVGDDPGRLLCALLLPEDDPAALAGRWRSWPPHAIDAPDGAWRDGDRACLRGLFTLAAAAADRHLADEGPEPGAPYRLLAAAC
jgi:hypothetical protein